MSMKNILKELIYMNQELYNCAKNGKYYYPAWKHYDNSNANVQCDKCSQQWLVACLGLENTDLCLQCGYEMTNRISNMKGCRINEIICIIQENYPSLNDETKSLVIDKVYQIIESEEFRRNHEEYMNEWRTKRGKTEVFMIAEDSAYEVIASIINKHPKIINNK